jgi:hypothetical protein
LSYLYAVLYGVLYLNPKIRRIIRESKAPYILYWATLRAILAGSRQFLAFHAEIQVL